MYGLKPITEEIIDLWVKDYPDHTREEIKAHLDEQFKKAIWYAENVPVRDADLNMVRDDAGEIVYRKRSPEELAEVERLYTFQELQ